MKLNEVIGQKNTIQTIKLQLEACKQQNKMMSHTLLEGPGGTGKTSIALAIANELKLPFQQINTASLKDPLSLIYLFVDMDEGELKSQVIFLDEVHNLNNSRGGVKLQESLYTAMEGSYINYEVQGPNGKEVKKQEIPPFVLLAATTEGMSPSFLGRFKHVFRLEPYSDEEIQQIIEEYIDKDCGYGPLIAPYSRKNPRMAKRLCDWAMDFHFIDKVIPTKESVAEAMAHIGIFEGGLTNEDKQYLKTLANLKRSGVKNMAASTGISESKIVKEIEPFLIQQNYIFRTDRGRIINVDKIKYWS